jgi:hypothetical protein
MEERNIKVEDNTPISQLIYIQEQWSQVFETVNIFKG